jgi:uncharacterized membrane protein
VEEVQLYLVLKTIHVLAAMIFLGTGAGSAWYRIRADRSDDIRVIVWCQREIVRADWYFTVPSAIALPATAIAMVEVAQMPWGTLWIIWGIAGYAIAGLFWLPAAWLQIAMRRLAEESLAKSAPLPTQYRIYAFIWAALGVPSFFAAILTVWVMVAKHMAKAG